MLVENGLPQIERTILSTPSHTKETKMKLMRLSIRIPLGLTIADVITGINKLSKGVISSVDLID